jgi:hypothetical protein
MNNVTFEKSVNELATLKDDIRRKNPVIRAMHRIFTAVFKREAREFAILSDMRFWRKGNPTPDSTAKINKFLDKFAILAHYYHFMGDNEIENYLKTKGIDITPNIQLLDTAINMGNIDPNDWQEAMGDGDAGIPDRTQAVLLSLLERSEEIKKDIYKYTDTFKQTVEDTSTKENLRPGHVSKAAHLRYKQGLKKSVDKDIAKVKQDVISAEESISIFE